MRQISVVPRECGTVFVSLAFVLYANMSETASRYLAAFEDAMKMMINAFMSSVSMYIFICNVNQNFSCGGVAVVCLCRENACQDSCCAVALHHLVVSATSVRRTDDE